MFKWRVKNNTFLFDTKIVRKTVCKSNRSGADFSLPFFKKCICYSWPVTAKEPDSNLHPQSWRQAAGVQTGLNWFSFTRNRGSWHTVQYVYLQWLPKEVGLLFNCWIMFFTHWLLWCMCLFISLFIEVFLLKLQGIQQRRWVRRRRAQTEKLSRLKPLAALQGKSNKRF